MRCCMPILLPLALHFAIPPHGEAHPKGQYTTRAEAEARARQLGCKGTQLRQP